MLKGDHHVSRVPEMKIKVKLEGDGSPRGCKANQELGLDHVNLVNSVYLLRRNSCLE
jgi:hypothetical protein